MRRLLSGLLFFGIFLLFSVVVFAGENNQVLHELLDSIHNLQGNFVQTVLDGHGKSIQKSEGKMALQRPGQFRWEVLKPIPQLIIANHARLWVYDPDLEQVVIRPLAKTAGQSPAFLLSNVGSGIDKDFIVRSMPAAENWQWFSLSPRRQDDSMFKVIQLGFLDHEIKEMRMQDNLGHNTIIQFKQLKKNGDLAASLFKFSPPAHVDVIDETR